MPMRPRRSLYPANWETIAAEVKAAAGWCCEQCGHGHEPDAGYTLTVHHIDGDPQNNALWNLVALCQRCHLKLHGQKRIIGQLMFIFVKPSWLRQREALRARQESSLGGDTLHAN